MDTPALSRGLTRPCRPAPAPASLLAALPLTRPPPARPSLGSPPARPGVPRLHRPAGPSPLARSAVAAPGIQPPRAWTRPRCRQASSAFPPMPAPASAPLSLPAARPPAPSPPTRPVPLARLCLACIAQPAHRPRTPLPSRSGAPRPRADSHAPAASALRAFRPTPAPAFRRAVRACAARSPGALASSRSPRPARLVPLARLCPLHRSAACPPYPALSAPELPTRAHRRACAVFGMPRAHHRRCLHQPSHLHPCLPPGPPPRRALPRSHRRVCPAVPIRHRHSGPTPPRAPRLCRPEGSYLRAHGRARCLWLHARAPADPRTCIPSCRPAARALADRSPPIRRAPSPPRPVVPRLHRPAARNPLAHPALAAPGRAGLSPEASVTKGRE